MHIAVFGATSSVGKATVVKLIEQNHTVTAFENDSNPFINHPSIRIVQGDIQSTTDVVRALEGADGVITTMGVWRGSTAFAPAMRNILTEMEHQGIWRIVALTHVVAHIEGDSLDLTDRWVYKLYKLIMPKLLRDYEDQVRFLQSSKADWTVIRVPGMYGRGKKGAWELSLHRPYPWQHVHIEDAAAALVSQLSDTHYVTQTPFLRGK